MEKCLQETMKFEDNQFIKNKELIKQIKYKLGKNEFSKSELNKIQDIILDGETFSGEKNNVYFDEVKLFTNLEEIKISNVKITEEEIEKISNLNTITFEKCQIEDILPIKKVKNLSIITTQIKNFKDIETFKQLESLELTNINIQNFEFLKELPNLKKLSIKNIPNFSLDKINFDLPIEYLSIQDVKEISLKSISNFKYLNTLSVEIEKITEWKNILNNLKNKKIKILLNDIYEF